MAIEHPSATFPTTAGGQGVSLAGGGGATLYLEAPRRREAPSIAPETPARGGFGREGTHEVKVLHSIAT
jgi:hypothetical protein